MAGIRLTWLNADQLTQMLILNAVVSGERDGDANSYTNEDGADGSGVAAGANSCEPNVSHASLELRPWS